MEAEAKALELTPAPAAAPSMPVMALYLMRKGAADVETGEPDAEDKAALEMVKRIEAGELEVVIRKVKREYHKETNP